MRAAISSLLILAGLCCTSRTVLGQGYILPGVGPINRSMGGAGTAAPLDATGAIQWNPASITALPGSRADIGVDVVINRNQVNSAVFFGTPMQVAGSTNNDAGYSPLPAIGLVYHRPDSYVAYGLGVNVIGGFFVNYPGSLKNPIFTPQPPVGMGFGPSYVRLGFMQIAPTIAWELTDRLAVGIAPTIDIVDAQASPFPFAAPNPDGSYSPATGNRNVWGMGVQGGIYYEDPSGVNLGFSVKSPQWFSTFKFNSEDDLGLPREVTTQVEYPMILSLGASYSGIKDLLFAVDVRWIDFAATQAFGEPAKFNPNGALRGLGWQSVWFAAAGVQWKVTDRLTVRAGYSYNQNPIPSQLTALNVFAPGIFQHVLNIGTSLQLTDSIIASLTWSHGFDNTITGPLLTPLGPVPLSRVALNQAVDSAILGLSVLF